MFLALALAAVHFPGGSAADLAKALSGASHLNVVIAQAQPKQIPAFDFDPKSFETLAWDVKSHSGMRIVAGTDVILTDDLLPGKLAGMAEPSTKWKDISTDSVKDGKVTFETTGEERLNAAALEQLKFDKPVKVHWILRDQAMAVKADSMPATEFLTYVAKATGGRFANTKDAYMLSMDTEAIRRRALNLLALRGKTVPPGDESKRIQGAVAFISKVLQDLTPAGFAQVFASANNQANFDIPANNPEYAVLLRQLAAADPTNIDLNALAIRGGNGTVQYLDPRRPARLTVGSNFTAILSLSTRNSGRGGRQPGGGGGQIQLQFSVN